ncbi:MAG: flagellin [Verrucomicrobia bacterium]|nr:flagellin [Verrucomicrobiota bacterium]
MNITTNIPAAFAARNLNKNQEMLSTSLNRLSSGTKIIKPSDDAAGLAVSEKLLSQNARLEATVSNIQSAVSYIQTADGFMGNMSKILTRMSELTTLAKDVTKNAGDVALYQEEFVGLQQQLRDTVGGGTVTTPMGAFNGNNLFGTNAAGLTVTIGEEAGQTMKIGDSDLQTGAMGILLTQTTPPAFDNDLTMAGTSQMITDAINHVATERADLGASMSRLEFAAGSLSVEGQNLESAVSRIRDVDVAEESTRLARNNILVQSATSMLAQANQMPQAVLKLLQ